VLDSPKRDGIARSAPTLIAGRRQSHTPSKPVLSNHNGNWPAYGFPSLARLRPLIRLQNPIDRIPILSRNHQDLH